MSATKANCVCCRNLGVLPTSPGPKTYAVPNEQGGVDLVEVPKPTAVPGEVIREMCDACVTAAFITGTGHPHRMSVSLSGGGR